MTGDHHGQTAGMATLLARALDELLGTHRSTTALVGATNSTRRRLSHDFPRGFVKSDIRHIPSTI
jgi:hypothetical protein